MEAAAAQGGPYSDLTGTGSTPTLTIIPATTSYTAYDPAGAATTWYRSRYENVGATRASDWSDPFQVGTLLYAELDELKEMINPPDDSNDNLMLDLLRQGRAPELNRVLPGDSVDEVSGFRERLDAQKRARIAADARRALERMIEITEAAR